MELRHLRYFVAVAEAGNLTVAARDRLHTTQPSLSRQMTDLEAEVGAKLFTRNVRGIELTAAGRVFLDHARVVLSQVEIGIESARRLAEPEKPHFVLGFLTGHESTWLPEALRLLHDEIPNIHIVVTSQVSPHLAQGLIRGDVDAAFIRPQDSTSEGLAFRLLTKEPLEVFMPEDHRLARLKSVSPQQLVGETFLSVSGKALNIGRQPALRVAIDAYLKRCGLDIKPSHEVDNLAGIMSLITSTRGVALLPTYAKNLLFGPVTSRPLRGEQPTIDLCLGYKKDNDTPVLKVFLSRLDELISRVSSRKPRPK